MPCSQAVTRRAMGEQRVTQRRYAPKVRSGCVTCKIRRVKCDEAKPSCARCTSTGRRCDGYASSPEANSKRAIVASESPSKTLNFGLAYDALEKRTFEFFRLKTTVCMSGYFQDPVWSQLVLQACHTEPVVRHAVNALGALHEERYLRGEASENRVEASLVKTEFPTRQYAKALAGFQKLLCSGKASVNVVLLTALLCIHFESLQEHFIPALTHAENAMRLLDPSQAPSTEAIDPSLLRAFVRIDLQGAFFIGIRLPSLSFITSAIDNELPASFTDLTQARNFVTTWSCRLFNFLRLTADKHKFVSPGFVALEALAEAQSYERTFTAIERLLFAFMQKPNIKLTFREHHGLAMLRALAIENRIIAAGCLYTEASFYDRFMPEMEQMLAICRFVLEAEDATNRLLSVSLDEGMLRPLWFVVTHCRDSRVRRGALALLQQLSDSHGVWHVEAMTKAAEICIRMEESGCANDSPRCEDIPEWRRVHSSGFDAWILAAPTRNKVVAKLRMRPNGMDGEWVDIDELFECRESDTNPPCTGEEDWYQQLDALVLEPPPYKLVPEQERVNKWP